MSYLQKKNCPTNEKCGEKIAEGEMVQGRGAEEYAVKGGEGKVQPGWECSGVEFFGGESAPNSVTHAFNSLVSLISLSKF